MSEGTKKVILKTSAVDMFYSALFMSLQYLKLLEDIDECVDKIGETIPEELKEQSGGHKSIKGYMVSSRLNILKNMLLDIERIVNQLEAIENKNDEQLKTIGIGTSVDTHVLYVFEKHICELDECAIMREV